MNASTFIALQRARSFLFVPGDKPGRFASAAASGVDAVIIDLEDAVAAERKHEARAAIDAAWSELSSWSLPWLLRINATDSDAGLQDLAWLRGRRGPHGLMVPKAARADDLRRAQVLADPVALLPLIESVAGWRGLEEVAAAPGVCRLVLGHLDFLADSGMRCGEDQRELDPLRFAINMASRLQGLAPAVDGVTTALRDEQAMARDVQRALGFGFNAKLCIHPAQVPLAHAALRPGDAELDWAQRVLAADRDAGGAAVQVDGQMVDRPVILRAQALLQRAG